MGELTHSELVDRAERWLKNTMGCGVVLKELTSYCSETPDAIGFQSGHSILVECKASRADFHAGKKKLFRQFPEQGMGNYRYYMCEPGIINSDDLPEKWGLLHVKGKRVIQVVNALNPKGGNIAQGDNRFRSEWLIREERKLLYSALRRVQ